MDVFVCRSSLALFLILSSLFSCVPADGRCNLKNRCFRWCQMRIVRRRKKNTRIEKEIEERKRREKRRHTDTNRFQRIYRISHRKTVTTWANRFNVNQTNRFVSLRMNNKWFKQRFIQFQLLHGLNDTHRRNGATAHDTLSFCHLRLTYRTLYAVQPLPSFVIIWLKMQLIINCAQCFWQTQMVQQLSIRFVATGYNLRPSCVHSIVCHFHRIESWREIRNRRNDVSNSKIER